MGIASDLVLIIVAGMLGGYIARLCRQPLLLGYIIVGILVGPYTGGITVSKVHDVEKLAEIGVGLLLFTLGIEFSLKELKPVKMVALIGTPIQILLTIVYGWGIGKMMGWDNIVSLWFGGFISLSSTMVVLKTLESKGLVGTLSSKVMLGMLVLQDLAIVPMLIIWPQLGLPTFGMGQLGYAGIKAAVFIVTMIFLGARIIPRVMEIVVGWHSREMFLLTISAIGLGVGYATHLLGLSFAFGAFAAGMVLSESRYSYQAISDLLPLRDIFSLLFFASMGMLIDPVFIWNNLGLVVLLAVLIMLGKGVVFALVSKPFGYGNVVPLALGMGMSQVGELSFLLLQQGAESGSIPRQYFPLFLGAGILTMMLTPLLSGLTGPLYSLLKKRRQDDPLQTINVTENELHEHVVILGGGRVGSFVAGILDRMDIVNVTIELNNKTVKAAEEQERAVIFGDATQPMVLEAAAVDKAKLILMTIPSVAGSSSAAAMLSHIAPNVPVVALVRNSEQIASLKSLGVTPIFPEFETGLEMTREALINYHVPAPEVQTFMDELRRERYTGVFVNRPEYEILSRLRRASESLTMNWVTVEKGSAIDGRSLIESNIRAATGASVVGIIRGGILRPNPDGGFRFKASDLAGVIGSEKEVNKFRELSIAEKEDTLIEG